MSKTEKPQLAWPKFRYKPYLNPHMAWQLVICTFCAALLNIYGSRNAQAFAMMILILEWLNWGIEWKPRE